MKVRSLRKGIEIWGAMLVQKAITAKGNLDQVIAMPVVSADGFSYQPVLVYQGTLGYNRKLNVQVQSLHICLSPCYLLKRNSAGVVSEIVCKSAKNFLEETTELRKKRRNVFLLLDGYESNVQCRTLKSQKDSHVINIALQGDKSHIIQPRNVSVLNSYKSFRLVELHRAAIHKTKLNAFNVSQCVHEAYKRSHATFNIS